MPSAIRWIGCSAVLAGLVSVVLTGTGMSHADTAPGPDYAGRPHLGLMDPAPGTGGIRPGRPVLTAPLDMSLEQPVPVIPRPMGPGTYPVKPVPRPIPRPRPVIVVPVTPADPLAGTGGIKPPKPVKPVLQGPLYIDPVLGPIYPWGPKPLPPKPVKVPPVIAEVDPYQTPPIVRPETLPGSAPAALR